MAALPGKRPYIANCRLNNPSHLLPLPQICSCHLQRHLCHCFAAVRAADSNIRMSCFKRFTLDSAKTPLIFSNYPWALQIGSSQFNWLSSFESHFHVTVQLVLYVTLLWATFFFWPSLIKALIHTSNKHWYPADRLGNCGGWLLTLHSLYHYLEE